MQQRSTDQITNVLCQLEVISYFGGQNNEEIDTIKRIDNDNNEISVSDIESKEDNVEDESDSGKGSHKCVYDKDKHKKLSHRAKI